MFWDDGRVHAWLARLSMRPGACVAANAWRSVWICCCECCGLGSILVWSTATCRYAAHQLLQIDIVPREDGKPEEGGAAAPGGAAPATAPSPAGPGGSGNQQAASAASTAAPAAAAPRPPAPPGMPTAPGAR